MNGNGNWNWKFKKKLTIPIRFRFKSFWKQSYFDKNLPYKIVYTRMSARTVYMNLVAYQKRPKINTTDS
jgi:hypothetical protein